MSDGRPVLQWIQCLRAFALLVVVAYHTGAAAQAHFGDTRLVHWVGFGHGGVDVFFVLSGFILFHLHQREFGRPENTGRYLKKRFVRIYPIYWVITTAVLLPALLLPGAIGAEKLTPSRIIESYLLFPVHYSGLPIVPPAWSLFHEVKFYAFFALLIALPAPWHRRWMALWCAGSIGATAWIMTGQPVYEHFWHFFWFGPHNLMFLAGCLSGWLLDRRKPGGTSSVVLLAAGLAVFAAIAWLEVSGQIARLARMGGYALAGFLLVSGCAGLDLGADGRIRAPSWLARLGDASYSAYLVHFPFLFAAAQALALVLGPEMTRQQALPLSAALFGLTLVLCLAVYRWVEKPLQRACRARAGLEAA